MSNLSDAVRLLKKAISIKPRNEEGQWRPRRFRKNKEDDRVADHYPPPLGLGLPPFSEPAGPKSEEPRAAESKVFPIRRKANTLGSCAKEDRRCAKGAMGEGEGGEEDGVSIGRSHKRKNAGSGTTGMCRIKVCGV